MNAGEFNEFLEWLHESSNNFDKASGKAKAHAKATEQVHDKDYLAVFIHVYLCYSISLQLYLQVITIASVVACNWHRKAVFLSDFCADLPALFSFRPHTHPVPDYHCLQRSRY